MQALAQKKKPSSEPCTISGNGKQVRDLLHVEDAVSCYLETARQIDEIKGEAFNIGGGSANSCSLLELFGMLEGMLSIKLRFSKLEWRHEDQRFFVADNSKISRATASTPHFVRTRYLKKNCSVNGVRRRCGSGGIRTGHVFLKRE